MSHRGPRGSTKTPSPRAKEKRGCEKRKGDREKARREQRVRGRRGEEGKKKRASGEEKP